MGQYKIEDLEKKIDYGKNSNKILKNEFIVQDDKKTVIYRGEIERISFNNIDNISGYPHIERYDEIEDIVKKKHIKWFPPKIEIEEIPIVRTYNIWSIPLFSYEMQPCFLIKNGKPVKDYQNMLKTYALNRGLHLSDELFNSLFGPIEEKLMKILEKIKTY